VKEDDAEREKRRASMEKHKSIKDAEKKKEKKKNLERQVLEERRSKSRHWGSLRRTPLTRMTKMMMTMTIPRGWRLALIGSYKTHRKPTSPRRVRGLPRGHKASTMTGTKRRHHPTAHAPTRPLAPI